MKNAILFMICALIILPTYSFAQEICTIDERRCILRSLEDEAAKIEKTPWRDQTYRELAKIYAFDGDMSAAIALIERIESSDTKAMTIRGIGMNAAKINLAQEELFELFTALRAEAEKIEHPPSYAIALTYIAMGQAFAGDNEGAWTTAASMKNEALRHKAYGETAEIQAERLDFEAAMKSISMIGSTGFRNKAYGHVSKILADRKALPQSLKAAQAIENSYQKAKALQYMLNMQKPQVKTDIKPDFSLKGKRSEQETTP